jgi:hypothetical protein
VTATVVAGRSDWLLFAHVAAAFVFAGAALTVVLAGAASARAADGARDVLGRLAYRVNILVLWPALIILVGAGAQLADAEDVYGRGWLRWAMVLTGVVAVVGGLLLAALARRRSRSPLVLVAGTISVVLLVVVFWLMTAKSGLA